MFYRISQSKNYYIWGLLTQNNMTYAILFASIVATVLSYAFLNTRAWERENKIPTWFFIYVGLFSVFCLGASILISY